MYSDGHQGEKYGKNAKKYIFFAFYGTPGGLLKYEHFFKRDVLGYLGL